MLPGGDSGPVLALKPWNARWLRLLSWRSAGSPSRPARQLRATAYLDGLRGFAAFLVYIHHHQLWTHASLMNGDNERFENAWGFQGDYRFATLPFVRNFFTGGHIAVAIFYVISGYVLSAKPLALIQAGEHLKVGDNVASALFRRWFRLYIPLILTTFVFVTSTYLLGIWIVNYPHQGSFVDELWNWYVEFKNFSFVFKEGPIWVSYNTHLWSIPLEMRGSIVTFAASLALSRATTQARLWCQVALMFYFIYVADGYYCALFVAGMLQCDLDLLARRDDDLLPRWLRRLEPHKTAIYWALFVVGMWLAGVPSQTADVANLRANPGWYWLSFLKPQAVYDPKWFFLFFAANMIVAAISRLPLLKRFFDSRFCQYLGRISFSLYLVHGPVLGILGDRVYAAVGWVRPIEKDQEMLAAWINAFPLPKSGPMGLEVAFLLPHLILLPVTFWVADVVTTTVDEPAVKVSSWMYKQVLGGPAEPKPEDALRLV